MAPHSGDQKYQESQQADDPYSVLHDVHFDMDDDFTDPAVRLQPGDHLIHSLSLEHTDLALEGFRLIAWQLKPEGQEALRRSVQGQLDSDGLTGQPQQLVWRADLIDAGAGRDGLECHVHGVLSSCDRREQQKDPQYEKHRPYPAWHTSRFHKTGPLCLPSGLSGRRTARCLGSHTPLFQQRCLTVANDVVMGSARPR